MAGWALIPTPMKGSICGQTGQNGPDNHETASVARMLAEMEQSEAEPSFVAVS